MIEYVAGFMFSEDRSHVALVEKQKPAWQMGKLNAIGGKIEEGETPFLAMIREFKEETGVGCVFWDEVAVLQGDDFIVHFFAAFTDQVYEARTMEAEQIDIYQVPYAQQLYRLMPNLKVLLPLALDNSGIVKPVMLRDRVPEATAQRGQS